MTKLDWQRVRSERGPALGILDVRFDWMRHPAGAPVLRRLVLESVDWVNVVALTADGLSIMVDQYRFGIGARTLETPGGMVDPGETPLAIGHGIDVGGVRGIAGAKQLDKCV